MTLNERRDDVLKQMIERYPNRARTPFEMLNLSVEEIQDIIRPCGLSPMKSKGIAGLSRKLHLQMIYYGREHCTARGCDGTVCEICRALFPKRRSVKR